MTNEDLDVLLDHSRMYRAVVARVAARQTGDLTMAEHTTTPWDFCKNRRGRRWAIYPVSARNDGIDYFIAEMQPVFADDESVEKANAAFIVQACNSHDALVAALEQAMDCIRGETPEDMTHEEARDDTIEKIRAALSLAKGEA